jgi:hypothetical protein
VRQKAAVSWPPFGTVENPIRMMVLEHDQTDEELKNIRRVSNGYTPPSDASDHCVALYDGLAAFERDMRDDIHAEDGVLFPRAVSMEEEACTKRKPAGSSCIRLGGGEAAWTSLAASTANVRSPDVMPRSQRNVPEPARQEL